MFNCFLNISSNKIGIVIKNGIFHSKTIYSKWINILNSLNVYQSRGVFFIGKSRSLRRLESISKSWSEGGGVVRLVMLESKEWGGGGLTPCTNQLGSRKWPYFNFCSFCFKQGLWCGEHMPHSPSKFYNIIFYNFFSKLFEFLYIINICVNIFIIIDFIKI